MMAEQYEYEVNNPETEQVTDESDVEIEDDTPESDRNRKPLPAEVVEELEKDELEDYTEGVKKKMMQLKKVWHDERREKERAYREQQEAIALAQRLLEENRRLKGSVNERDNVLASTFKEKVENELEMAKREYREAYESGDSDKLVEAQEKLTDAKIRADQVKRFRSAPLQDESDEVNVPQQPQRADPRALSWRERNDWFGTDRVMTALALGLHEEFISQHGPEYASTDEYYKRIDDSMRQYFPDRFRAETSDQASKATRRTGSATVVAPATRSTSPKKIVLKQSQLIIAKRLGITPEQYAKEFMKLEN